MLVLLTVLRSVMSLYEVFWPVLCSLLQTVMDKSTSVNFIGSSFCIIFAYVIG